MGINHIKFSQNVANRYLLIVKKFRNDIFIFIAVNKKIRPRENRVKLLGVMTKTIFLCRTHHFFPEAKHCENTYLVLCFPLAAFP